MRTRAAAGLTAALACAIGAAPAGAAQLVTWTTTSRFVDPAALQFNSPPPGAPARPNALRVNVYLPDGYDGRRRFPVLYLLHGHGDAFDYWANPARGDAARIAAGLGAVIVMPEAARGWYANWWNGGKRADPAWERYHLDELVPLVERRLRIRRGRRWHAIAGLSMGGEGAIFYASQRPGYFGSAASFSGVLSLERPEWPAAFDTQGERHQDVFGDPGAQRFYWTGHDPTALADTLRNTRLFVAVGDGVPGSPGEVANLAGALGETELRQHAADFVAAAQAAGASVDYRPQQGIHDWPYWRRHLAQALAWGFFSPVAERPREWRYETVAGSGDMWGLRFRFAAPPSALEVFKRNGAVLVGEGDGRVTILTADGCRFSATLPFSRALPSGCAIRLAVRPRTVPAGQVVRLRFRAGVLRGGRRLPLARVTVRLGGRRARTNRRGRASLRVRLRRGKHRARAARRGFRSAVVVVRAR